MGFTPQKGTARANPRIFRRVIGGLAVGVGGRFRRSFPGELSLNLRFLLPVTRSFIRVPIDQVFQGQLLPLFTRVVVFFIGHRAAGFAIHGEVAGRQLALPAVGVFDACAPQPLVFMNQCVEPEQKLDRVIGIDPSISR